MLKQQQLDDLRSELEAERHRLRRQLEDLGVSGEGAAAFDDGFADSGQVAAEQGETRVLAASLAEQLGDVEAAISKLEDGAYGRCEQCASEIGEARLEAMPATRYCIDHA